MKRAFDVDTIENALVDYEIKNKFKLNCSRFELALFIKEYFDFKLVEETGEKP